MIGLSIIYDEYGCESCRYGIQITGNCNGQIEYFYLCKGEGWEQQEETYELYGKTYDNIFQYDDDNGKIMCRNYCGGY